MTTATRIGFTALLIALGLGVGYGASYIRPVLYESSAVVQIVPARVAPSLIDPANVPLTLPLEERLLTIEQMVLSRTRLEGLTKEFGLFKDDGLLMQDTVELMRRRITFRPSTLAVRQVVVSYADRDPRSAMNVTARLMTMVIDESLKDSERRAENTASFLESQTEYSRQELEALSMEVDRSGRGGVSLPKRLELDVLQTRYKTLLIKKADAKAIVDLERRQIGEQFNLIDPARVPTRPMGPTRLEFALAGGAAGLGIAGLLMVARALRVQRDRRLLRPTTA